MKFFLKFLGVLFLFFSFLNYTEAQEEEKKLHLDFYYGESCPHCHEEMEWFPELKKQFPNLSINKVEVVENTENREKLEIFLKSKGEHYKGVPLNVINNEVIVLGGNKNKIITAFEGQIMEKEWWEKYLSSYWVFTAVSLGLIDGFNPCAMWSLIILIGFLLSVDNVKRRWIIGSVFLLSSGIIYAVALFSYLLGFSYLSKFFSEYQNIIFIIVGIMAVVSAFFSFYSYWQNQVECKIRNSEEKRKFHDKISSLIQKENLILVLPSVILLAFSVNSVELICSVAIPTTFTASLVDSNLSFALQSVAILIYDIFYMLDDVILFTFAMLTMKIINFSGKLVRYSYLFGGVILLVIGLFMIFNNSLLNSLFSF